MGVRKLKGSWWVDFQWKQVRHRRRSPVNSKGGAQQYEAALRNELLRHGSLEHLDRPTPAKPQVPTFMEFAHRWLREYVDVNNGLSERKNKRTSLRVHLLPFFGTMRLDEVTGNAVERFKAHLLGLNYCAKTVNTHLTVLNRCLGTAHEWGVLGAPPRIRLLKMTVPPFRFLTPAQTEALLTSTKDPILRAMIRTAARAGLRYSELRGLQWEDVDFVRTQLTVRHAFIQNRLGPTKNHGVRHVQMSADLYEELRSLPRGPSFVFADARAHPRLLDALKRACRLAGVPPVGWHDLRHTFASHLMAAGAPINAVKELLGHASVEMTMRYSHLAPSVLRSVVSLLGRSNDLWDEKCQPAVNRHSLSDATTAPVRPAEESIFSQPSKNVAVSRRSCLVGVDGVESEKTLPARTGLSPLEP